LETFAKFTKNHLMFWTCC